MAYYDERRHKRKMTMNVEERMDYSKMKSFYGRLVLPEYLKYFFSESGGVIKSSRGFAKKREAENYVSLVAVKRLYTCGLYGEDLYPNINRFLNQAYLQ